MVHVIIHGDEDGDNYDYKYVLNPNYMYRQNQFQ